jgi:hypothetical protein
VGSPEDREHAVIAASDAAAQRGVNVDAQAISDAVDLFFVYVEALGFSQAAAKLVHDIAVLSADIADLTVDTMVLSTNDPGGTYVALAALQSLSRLVLDDPRELNEVVHEERARLVSLTLSHRTLTRPAYEDLRNQLRILGQLRIRIILQLGLQPSLVAEP